MTQHAWGGLNSQIVDCNHCQRLRTYCQQVAIVKRKSFFNSEYWGRPVENFGSSQAEVLVVGLAPAAHGANRTGRMFTGDRSGLWLYRALHRFGFATHPESVDSLDTLSLINCAITAVVHCAPPQNKPSIVEIKNCQHYLRQLILLLPLKVTICLGQLAWTETFKVLRQIGMSSGPIPKFKHAAELRLNGPLHLIASFHPSQQNTFTGKLTEEMLDSIFRKARSLL